MDHKFNMFCDIVHIILSPSTHCHVLHFHSVQIQYPPSGNNPALCACLHIVEMDIDMPRNYL